MQARQGETHDAARAVVAEAGGGTHRVARRSSRRAVLVLRWPGQFACREVREAKVAATSQSWHRRQARPAFDWRCLRVIEACPSADAVETNARLARFPSQLRISLREQGDRPAH